MRDGRGTLGTCLAKAKGLGGDDSDKLLHSLKKTAQKGSACPADAPSWMNQPTVDRDRDSQDEALSLEMENDLSGADLLLHSGSKVLLCLKESVGRSSVPATAPSQAVGLSSAPVEECLAGVSCGVRDALGSSWPGREPRAMDGPRRQCPRGEGCVSGRPGHPKQWEMGVFKGEPPSAFPQGLGTELELSGLHSQVPVTPYTQPDVLLKDETSCIFLDRLKAVFSEQTVEDKKILSSIKSTS